MWDLRWHLAAEKVVFKMEFVILTGLSGAGKTRAMHAMEDIGFYCVDNLPPALIPVFYDLCAVSYTHLTLPTN